MASFGYPAVRVLGVQICFFTAAAAAPFRQGVPAHRWPKHARSVGVEGTGATNGTGWDGHAVGYLPARRTGNHAWLIDVSASQFSRPDHGLDVPQELIVPVSSTFMQGAPETHSLPSGKVLSRHEPALTRQVLEFCRHAADGLDVIAAEVTNRMTARLDGSAAQTESNLTVLDCTGRIAREAISAA